jgi:F0F1-type ATP synthase membrane subunit b/b'
MCLTDATNIIASNPDERTKKAALKALKEKMKKRRKEIADRIADIDRGLQAIENMIK